MNHNTTDDTIDLISLFCAAAAQWRRCLIAALIGSILLGGFAVAKTFIIRAIPDMYEETLQKYLYEQTAYEQLLFSKSQEVDNLRRNLQNQDTYLKESVLMQTDPCAQPFAEAHFSIALPVDTWASYPATISVDPTDSVGNAYSLKLYQHIDWDALSEKVGVASIYLPEHIGMGWDYGSNSLGIYTVGRTEQEAIDLLQELVAVAEGLYDEIAAEAGPHTLTLISMRSTVRINSELAQDQMEAHVYQENQLKLLEEAEASLKEKKKSPPEIPAALSGIETAKDAIKFGIVGAVLGGFLLAAYYVVCCLAKGKLHAEDDMTAQGILVLGVLSEQPNKLIIDRLLQKLSGRLHGLSDVDVSKCASIKLNHLYPDGARILFTGCIPSEDIRTVSAKLDTRSGKFQFVTGECIASSLQTLEQAAACDAVILVEKRDVSCLRTIRKEIVAAESIGKKIAGCIIL